MNFMKTMKTPTFNSEYKGKNQKDVINHLKHSQHGISDFTLIKSHPTMLTKIQIQKFIKLS